MSDFDETCRTIDAAEVALAVWDVGEIVLKGEGILRFIVANGVEEELSVTRISCRSLDEALDIERRWHASKH
jgi:hypothetical protein